MRVCKAQKHLAWHHTSQSIFCSMWQVMFVWMKQGIWFYSSSPDWTKKHTTAVWASDFKRSLTLKIHTGRVAWGSDTKATAGCQACGLFYSLFINCVFWFALQGWMHIKPEQYSIHSFRNFSHKNHLKQGSKGRAKYFRVCVCREWKSRAAAGREASEHTSVCTHSELQNNQKTPNQSSFCLWVCVGGVVLDKQLMWASY